MSFISGVSILLVFKAAYISVSGTHSEEHISDHIFYSGAVLDNLLINRVITLQNVTVFISNTIIIDTIIYVNATITGDIFVQNCTFEGGHFKINSASNVTIMDTQFIVQNIAKHEASNYVLTVYNTSSLFVSNTVFGNLLTESNEMRDISGATSLGIRLENVSISEIRKCTFTGIKSAEGYGVALSLKNTEVKIISSNFQFNSAKFGVIHATNGANITNINCSFISNRGFQCGVVCMLDNCTLLNSDSVYSENIVTVNGAAAVYGKRWCNITNVGTTFADNTGVDGIIILNNHGTLINDASLYR